MRFLAAKPTSYSMKKFKADSVLACDVFLYFLCLSDNSLGLTEPFPKRVFRQGKTQTRESLREREKERG